MGSSSPRPDKHYCIKKLIAGLLQTARTNAEQGSVLNVVVGIIGAVIGGFLFQTFGAAGVTGFNVYSLTVAIVGAIVLLAIVKALR